MKIGTILLIAILFALNSKAQTLNEATEVLKKVKNIEQVELLKSQYAGWDIYIDKTMYSDSIKFPEIISAKVNDIVLKQYNPQAPTYVIKVLKEQDEELCKAKYIYLDGSKLTKSEIDSIRSTIVNRYTKGEDFEVLVKDFNMDSNKTGDLNWFSRGMMVEEFDNPVRKRKKGEIFSVDVAKNKWYYVVLKTHDNRMERAKIALMIKYGI